MCQKDLNAVVKQIWNWRNEFENGKDLHKFLNENISKFNSVQIASAFFIYNRITFREQANLADTPNKPFVEDLRNQVL